MKLLYALVSLPCLAVGASPVIYSRSPPSSKNTSTETAFVNLALALGSLQSAFYNQSLSQFNDSAFNTSGFGPGVRPGFVQISLSKAVQVEYLNRTLGSSAPPPCTYNFTDINNVTTFAQMSLVLENIGTSAYIGSIQNITNATYQTAAASLLSNDARYASWIATVKGVEAWDGPFDIPLTPNQVITLLSPYIISCPKFNGTASFSAAANLTVSAATAGSNATFTFTNSTSTNGTSFDSSGSISSSNGTLYAVFFQGLNHLFIPLSNNTATVPGNLTGISYVAVVNSSSVVSDSTTVAGPAFLDLTYTVNRTSPTSSVTTSATSSTSSGPPFNTGFPTSSDFPNFSASSTSATTTSSLF